MLVVGCMEEGGRGKRDVSGKRGKAKLPNHQSAEPESIDEAALTDHVVPLGRLVAGKNRRAKKKKGKGNRSKRKVPRKEQRNPLKRQERAKASGGSEAEGRYKSPHVRQLRRRVWEKE